MNDHLNKVLKTVLALFISAALLGISVNLYIYAGLGSDSITVFEDGLHSFVPMNMGTASYVYSFVTISLAFLIGKKHIGWISIAYSLLCGPSINFFNRLFSSMQLFDQPFLRVLVLCLAIFCTALSCTILILTKNGMNSLDAIATGLAERIHLEYKYIRTSLDIVLIIAGWLMGGTIGIGTIPAVLLTGTLIDKLVHVFQLKLNQK